MTFALPLGMMFGPITAGWLSDKFFRASDPDDLFLFHRMHHCSCPDGIIPIKGWVSHGPIILQVLGGSVCTGNQPVPFYRCL